MSFTVFLGNLPTWVTADDIKGWLSAESLVADAIKVIRNPETQESKGFAFIESPNGEEMNSIIRRFDRAPLEDRLLRANPAQPPKAKGPADRERRPGGYPPSGGPASGGFAGGGSSSGGPAHGGSSGGYAGGQNAFASQSSASASQAAAPPSAGQAVAPQGPPVVERPPRRGKKSGKRPGGNGPQSAFAEELAKAL